MSKTHRVLNLTRGHLLKFKQAETAVEVCSAVWVEYGVSIRDVTGPNEARTLRKLRPPAKKS